MFVSFGRRAGGRASTSLGGQALLVVACLAIAVPCYFLFLGSFKTVEEFFASPFGPPSSFSLQNYRDASHEAEIPRAFVTSVVVTSCSVVLGTAASCLASYAIACLRMHGGRLLRALLVAGLFVPVQVISLAVFVEMRMLGLLGSIWSLVIMYATLGLQLGVVVLVGYFQTIPRELSEAAMIDGASRWRTLWQVYLPLSHAPIMAVTILNGVWVWNDFYLPLVFSSNSSIRTLPLAILDFFGTYSTEYGLVFAAVVVSALPVVIVFVLMTRRFIEGVTSGAVKG